MNECVIILHGMGRTSGSMGPVEDHLEKAGYTVWNRTYPSTSQTIEQSAITHIDRGIAYCRQFRPAAIHFVTHSLGGILVRYYLQNRLLEELGRIVMLSPPNKGSEVADTLKDSALYKWVTGPAGQQLGTGPDGLPNRLHPVCATIGVIAGIRSSDPWFSPIIPGEDDGKVSVDSAKLEEMTDFLMVESGHTFIMRNSLVIDQIQYFIENGVFKK